MQTLSQRWSVSFGAFTLSGTLKSDPLESAIRASAEAFKVPEHPDKVIKICAPCGMFDPAGAVNAEHFLDTDGNTWVACGTRSISNAPSPALVEAEFRRAAKERFGDDWSSTKKSKLNYLKKKAKSDLAARTPFRLSETGGLFICLQTGDVISVGNAGLAVSRDLVGRISELTRVDFRNCQKETSAALLAFLRTQEQSLIPWPTGTAALSRVRGAVRETCSVRTLSWAKDSPDAAVLLANAWAPQKIEVQWGDGRKGQVGLTGALESVSWGSKIESSDPQPAIEVRLSMLREMNAAILRFVSANSGAGAPLLLPE